jgi:hypothetical protein
LWGKLAQLKIFTCYLRGKLLFPAITRRHLISASSRCCGSEIADSAGKYPSSFLLNSKNHPISPIVPPYFKSINEKALIWALLTYRLCLFVESEEWVIGVPSRQPPIIRFESKGTSAFHPIAFDSPVAARALEDQQNHAASPSRMTILKLSISP